MLRVLAARTAVAGCSRRVSLSRTHCVLAQNHATDCIQRVLAAFEDGKEACSDTFNPQLVGGVLQLDLGDRILWRQQHMQTALTWLW